MDCLYTICILAAFRMPPVFTCDWCRKWQRMSFLHFLFPTLLIPLYKVVPTMKESVILASAKHGRSVFLASNPWEHISLYQHNVANADSG